MGMPCLKCGKTAHCRDTRRRKSDPLSTKRRYQCLSCKARFTTCEFPVDRNKLEKGKVKHRGTNAEQVRELYKQEARKEFQKQLRALLGL